MAPSRHDWKIVDWDVKPQHNQPTFVDILKNKFEPAHDKTNQITCAPSEDSDQPGRPPSLIGVFTVRMEEPVAVLGKSAYLVLLYLISSFETVFTCLTQNERSFILCGFFFLSSFY